MILKKKTAIEIAAFALLFLGVLVFYTSVHPYVPWVGDDWSTLSGNPHAIPHPAYYTSRILPPILGTLCGHFGAFVIYPLNGDYLFSLILSTALFYSAIITALFAMLYKFFLSLSYKKYLSALCTAIVFAFSFMFLKSKGEDNWYLFDAVCNCGVFYYHGPLILSYIAILYDLRRTIEGKYSCPTDTKTISVTIPIVYFITMASTISNIPLFIYITLKLITVTVLTKKKVRTGGKQSFIIWCKNNWVYLWYYIVFILHAAVEFTGTQAGHYLSRDELGLYSKMIFILKQWKDIVAQFNTFYTVISLMVIILAMICFIRNRIKKRRISNLEILLAITVLFGIGCIFVVLCFQVVTNMVITSMILPFSPFLALFIFLAICLVFIYNTFPKAIIFMPFMLCVLGALMINPYMPLIDSAFFYETTPEQKVKYVNVLIEQVREAVDSGGSEITLKLPPDTWGATTLSTALYHHGIIERDIDIYWEN